MSTIRERASALAEATCDAYMADMYGESSWRQCCVVLLKRGYTEPEAEAILRSKVMRWADDSFGHGAGRGTTSGALVRALDAWEGEPFAGHATFEACVRDELTPETETWLEDRGLSRA